MPIMIPFVLNASITENTKGGNEPALQTLMLHEETR